MQSWSSSAVFCGCVAVVIKRTIYHIDFRDEGTASIVVRTRLTVTGTDAGMRMIGGISAPDVHVPLDSLSALRDSISYRIVLGVWDRSPLAPSLPMRALPHTTAGLVRFLEAEQLVAEERWQAADTAYKRAEQTDNTCWICSWRITEIDRWLGRQPDADRVYRVHLHADSLPALYRSLIRAPQLPERQRLDTLRAAAEGTREIFLGWFQLGDEIFHRGPLAGHRRAEAIPARLSAPPAEVVDLEFAHVCLMALEVRAEHVRVVVPRHEEEIVAGHRVQRGLQ